MKLILAEPFKSLWAGRDAFTEVEGLSGGAEAKNGPQRRAKLRQDCRDYQRNRMQQGKLSPARLMFRDSRRRRSVRDGTLTAGVDHFQQLACARHLPVDWSHFRGQSVKDFRIRKL